MGSRPLTARDLEVLAFAAEHRFILADQLAALLGVTPRAAGRRLYALQSAGLLGSRELFQGQRRPYAITRRGLTAIGSPLPAPRLDLRQYLHDVGVAWVWVQARRGALGAVSEVLSERRLRSTDGLPRPEERARESPRLALRLWDWAPGGHERLHYPDLVLRTPTGRRVAVELELSGKGPRRLERILAAYAHSRDVDHVVYLADRPELERAVRQAAVRAGASDKVHVQRFAWPASTERLAAQLGRAAGRKHALEVSR